MGYPRTDYYETIIQRHIRAGRASNKSEVIHQALALLDAVTGAMAPKARVSATRMNWKPCGCRPAPPGP